MSIPGIRRRHARGAGGPAQWREAWAVAIACVAAAASAAVADGSAGGDTALWRAPSGLVVVTHRSGSDAVARGSFAVALALRAGTVHEEGGDGEAQVAAKLATAGSRLVPPAALRRRFDAAGLRPAEHLTHRIGYTHTLITLEAAPGGERLELGAAYLASLVGIGSGGESRSPGGPFIDESTAALAHQRLAEAAMDDMAAPKRLTDRVLPRLTPESLVGTRLPGALRTHRRAPSVDAIDRFSRERYTPGNAALIVVTALPHAETRARLAAALGDLEHNDGPGGQPAVKGARSIGLPAGRGVTAAMDPGLAAPVVQAMRFEAPPAGPADAMGVREIAAGRVAVELLRTGLSALRDADAAGVFATNAGVYRFDPAVWMTTATVVAGTDESDWESALRALWTEMRRVSERDASPAELGGARAAVITADRARRERLSRADAGAIAGAIAARWARGEPPAPTPAFDAGAFADAVGRLDAAAVRDAARRALAPGGFGFGVLLPGEPDAEHTEHARRRAATIVGEVAATPIEPVPADPELGDGEARFVSRTPEPQRPALIEFRQGSAESLRVSFGNGIVVRAVRGSDEPDEPGGEGSGAGGRVAIAAAFGAGPLTGGANAAEWLAGAQQLSLHPATGACAAGRVAAIARAAGVSFTAVPSEELLVVKVEAPRGSAARGFELLHGLMRDPRIGPIDAGIWERGIAAYARQPKAVHSVAFDAATIIDGDPRTTPADTAALDPARAAHAVEAALTRAPASVAVAGDLPAAEMIELAARYLGTLPERRGQLTADLLAQHPRRGGPAGAIGSVQERALDAPRAAVTVGRRLDGELTTEGVAALHAAAGVLRERVARALAEEAGVSPDIDTAVVTTRGPLRVPRLTLSFLVSPGDAGAARETANREIHRLAARPPSAEELDRAGGPIAEEWADALRRAGRLACDAALAAVYPEQHPDELGRRLAALRAIGPRHLQRAVARFDTPDRRIEVTVLPRRRAEPARE